MNTDEKFTKQSADIIKSASHLLIFLQRSNRLATRLLQIIALVSTKYSNPDQTDLYTQTTINLLTVTVDDVLDYFKALTVKSPALDAHLLKYGSDEECFYKWNERLRLISVTLGLEGTLKIFDVSVDHQDLKDDIKSIRDNLQSITSNNSNQKHILALISSQETNMFKTVQNVEKMAIKAKCIKYDKLLGSGMRICLI